MSLPPRSEKVSLSDKSLPPRRGKARMGVMNEMSNRL